MDIELKEAETQSPAPLDNTGSRLRAWAAIACAAAFALYSSALWFGFVWDDRLQIVGNAAITSWHNLPNYFLKNVWYYTDPHLMGNYWRPFFLTWLLISHSLFGMNPMGYHLINLLVHVAVTWLVYRVALRLTRDGWTAAIAALLFAVHPAHLEAVVWISGITDPVMSVFFLGSFLCWLRSREEARRGWWLAAALALYVSALLMKEPTIVLPGVIAVAAWLFAPQGTSRRERLVTAVRQTLPFAVVTAIYLPLRFVVLSGMSHGLSDQNVPAMLLTWPAVLWFYLRQLIFPVGLSGFYDLPFVHHPGLFNFVLPLLGVAAIAGGIWYAAWRTRNPLIAFAGWWMVITLLPALDILIFYSFDIVHDRYLYLPSVGFVLLVAMGLRKLRPGESKILGAPSRQAIAVLVLAAAYCATCIPDQMVWKDDLRLYRRGIAVAPNNVLPTLNYGVFACDANDFPLGVKLFQEVVRKQPEMWDGNFNLGYAYYLQGENEGAEKYMTRAIELRPLKADEWAYRAVARMKLGKLDEAVDDVQIALRLTPNGQRFHYAYGLILEKQGHLSAAADEFRAELRRKADDKTVQEALQRVEQEMKE